MSETCEQIKKNGEKCTFIAKWKVKLNNEQEYIHLYKPILNLNPVAGSSVGSFFFNYKHSEESKKLISEFRKGKPLSKSTKIRLSALFSGELNPF